MRDYDTLTADRENAEAELRRLAALLVDRSCLLDPTSADWRETLSATWAASQRYVLADQLLDASTT